MLKLITVLSVMLAIMTIRHIPTSPTTFEAVVKDMVPSYNKINNWKYSPTHNIQKSTFQNESCESCHDNDKLFSNDKDLRESDSEENKKLIVPRP